MKIQVIVREVYGKPLIYPHCKDAKLFAALVNKLTLSPERLAVIENLGYEVELVNDNQTWREAIQ